MKIAFLILLTFPFYVYSECPNLHLLDSLYSPTFNENFKRNEVEELFDALDIKNCTIHDSALTIFLINNKGYGKYAIRYLVKAKSKYFLKLLIEQKDKVPINYWSTIAEFAPVKEPWYDKRFTNALIEQLISNPIHEDRLSIAIYFEMTANYPTCVTIKELIPNEIDERVIQRLVLSQLRFQNTITNQEIAEQIRSSPYILTDAVKYGFKQYNRYDFLPELYALRKRMQAETNPLRKADAGQILKTLDDVIPYLEKKKDEKAAIGLPLDWGIEKR